MGYPMSYQRVVNRSHLHEGSYQTNPMMWHARPGKVLWDLIGDDPDALLRVGQDLEKDWAAAADRFNEKVRLLAGDLRRLERDTVDENACCKFIAARTSLDEDDVAAVLKEFIQW